jgi:hypothetical protein
LPLPAKTRSSPAAEPGYVSALGAADHFLQAWQSSDPENGMALLTSHAKQKVTTGVLENFFSTASPCAYEIGRGKLLKRGRYEFPVVLIQSSSRSLRFRRRSSSIVMIDTDKNDWAVDKLP